MAALDIRVQVSRVIAVAIVELMIAGGFIWSAKQSRPAAAGVGTAGVIVGILVFSAAMATL